MSLISFTPVTDGSTASASGVNTPLSTIYNDYNGGITDANIASAAAIATSKLSLGSQTGTSWTPTYTASGSMTYTSVTTTVAKYIQVGKLVYFYLSATGTTGGTTNNTIYFTLPVTAASTSGAIFAANISPAGGVAVGGFATLNTTSQAGFRRYDSGNITLGASTGITVSGFYEAA